MVTKQVRNFGGRPTERELEPGKKVHMSLAVPLTLKRKVEQAAKKRGWSVSNEAAHRLELSFSMDVAAMPHMTHLLLDAIRDGFKEMAEVEKKKGGK